MKLGKLFKKFNSVSDLVKIAGEVDQVVDTWETERKKLKKNTKVHIDLLVLEKKIDQATANKVWTELDKYVF